MPVLDNPINTRLEIIKLAYNQSDRQVGRKVSFYAAQIDGGYHSEIHHQLKFLKERGLVDFSRNMISKRLTVELTESGHKFMEDAYGALKLPTEEKDKTLDELFKQIRL